MLFCQQPTFELFCLSIHKVVLDLVKYVLLLLLLLLSIAKFIIILHVLHDDVFFVRHHMLSTSTAVSYSFFLFFAFSGDAGFCTGGPSLAVRSCFFQATQSIPELIRLIDLHVNLHSVCDQAGSHRG